MKIEKICIYRIPGTEVSDALRELLHKLLETEVVVFSDKQTINRFLAHGNNRIEEFVLPAHLILPIEVQVFFTSSSNFSLIYDSDFIWFLNHLKNGTLPDKSGALVLASRNSAAIAFTLRQKQVEAMQLT